MHLWRMLAKVIPTRDQIHNRTHSGDIFCVFCDAEVETSLHLFSQCHFIRALAFGSQWSCKLDNISFVNVHQLVEFCLDPVKGYKSTHVEKSDLSAFLACLFYFTWSARNDTIYRAGRSFLEEVNKFNIFAGDYCQDLSKSSGSSIVPTDPSPVEEWKAPPPNWLKINVDAAFKKEDAAAAMVVRDNRGKLLFLDTKLFKCYSAMDAEIQAIEWASSKAEHSGWKNIQWSIDAKEVTKIILDSSFPANWSSWYEIQNLRIRFGRGDWKLEWNRREQNIVADSTAKYVLDHKCLLKCDEFSTRVLPFNIIDRLMIEQEGSGM